MQLQGFPIDSHTLAWVRRMINLNRSSSPPSYHEPFQDEVLTVVERVALSPTEICGFILGSSCAHFYNPFKQEWNVTVPGNKPPVIPVPPPKVWWFYFSADVSFSKSFTVFVACSTKFTQNYELRNATKYRSHVRCSLPVGGQAKQQFERRGLCVCGWSPSSAKCAML